jgi:Tfp pilus assembly PilM family ATPase
VADLKQLYAKEKVSSSRNGTSITYEVHVTRSGRNIKLVSGLESSEQAVYIEQEIEKYLNIKDIPVKGELAR